MKNFMKNEDNKIFSQNVSSSYHLEDKKRAVPKLRFKGYNDEWKHYRLKDFTTRVTRKNSKLESERPLTISAINGLIDQKDYFNRQIASKDMSGYYLLKKGEFAYNKSYSNGYPYGSIKRLNKYDNGALSTLYICFSCENINSDFLEKYFDTDKWYKEIYIIAVEGARNHGLLNISVDDFFSTIHKFPSLPEQEKIASFLTLIDKKIEKQKELVELLKKYKRGLLSQIFSQKLRFKDAEGNDYPEWEEKQIKDIFTFYNGKAHEKEITENGKYIVVNSKFISTSGQVKKYINEMIVPLKKNDIVMVMSDVPNGKAMSKCYLIENDNIYSLNQRICALRTNMIAQYFIYQISRNQYFLKFDNGVSQTNLRKEDVLKCPVIVPIIKEQIKISNIISKLDNIIEKENILLDSYNYYKKGLLQKMFI